jgi:hypothetical protein
MKAAMGPWGVGATVAHYLFVLICYKYNVNAGVRRNAEQNFGHPYHCIVDQLQIAMQEIYNALVYPRDVNVSLFEHVKDFVSLGIGSLCYSKDFVESGNPLDNLMGDMRFMAERMKVTSPPLEPSSKEEHSLINKHFVAHPKQINATLKALAKKVLELADGVKIFPKLLSQLEAYHKKWQRNNLIKDAIQKMGLGGYTKLPQSLASPRRTMAGGIALFKASQIHAPPKNPLLWPDGPESLKIQQYVAPIVALLQRAQILTLPSLEGSAQQRKKCVYFPYCKFAARFCGGTKRDGCREVNKGEIPPWDHIIDEKRKRQNNDRMERKRQKKPAETTKSEIVG